MIHKREELILFATGCSCQVGSLKKWIKDFQYFFKIFSYGEQLRHVKIFCISFSIKKVNCGVRPRWRCRQKSLASSHNQKEDNNQSKINKQPEVPENQTAWNSDNQGMKERVNQTNQTGKMGGWREPTGKLQTLWVGLS